jgi:hypothetical protein
MFPAVPHPARQTVTLRPPLRVSGGAGRAVRDATKAFRQIGMTYLSITQPSYVIVITAISTRIVECCDVDLPPGIGNCVDHPRPSVGQGAIGVANDPKE